jgi:hypothetical protein
MHIMKTSGTSLGWSIRRSVPPEVTYPTGGPSDRRARQYWLLEELDAVEPEARARLRVFMGHFPFHANERFGATDVISILRAPVERTISHLLHVQRMPGNEARSLEAIYEGFPGLPTPLVDYQVRQFALTPDDTGPEPLPIDEARYRLALERLESLAVLGRTDQLATFVDALDRRYGWRSKDVRLEVAPPGAEVPAALVRRIEADCAADLAFYADACSLLARRGPSGS